MSIYLGCSNLPSGLDEKYLQSSLQISGAGGNPRASRAGSSGRPRGGGGITRRPMAARSAGAAAAAARNQSPAAGAVESVYFPTPPQQ